ncbi:precorrin-6A synthase (deacetylating) [Pseudomonas oryzihabitans]|uniref:precorrin-6A synthase (deacetylating) n=1 Tax=Pseudomonas oryzihabitans TaxID=47885 RepID=UPI000EE6FF40|nr:precorrin-6A synthase (deacetylating) [Pseudomonas oryzihabitans]HCV75968.1 precorrin-6A synthase (deacetylating) [Pseudomonas sp.]
MKTLLVIGIGAGDPDYLTLQAIAALNRASTFFLFDKGAEKDSLIHLRETICARHIKGDYRFVTAPIPERRREGDYHQAVDDLNAAKQALMVEMIEQELADDECGAFLVWGDPALYDSTLRILAAIKREGRLDFDYEVIPGISSVQALAARHRVPLNRIGQALEITPGRRLERFPAHLDSLVVMLDSHEAYRRLDEPGLHIYWGAYVGTADEILIAGPLQEVAEEIHRVRSAAREEHGWIMDTYLLCRGPADA